MKKNIKLNKIIACYMQIHIGMGVKLNYFWGTLSGSFTYDVPFLYQKKFLAGDSKNSNYLEVFEEHNQVSKLEIISILPVTRGLIQNQSNILSCPCQTGQF